MTLVERIGNMQDLSGLSESATDISLSIGYASSMSAAALQRMPDDERSSLESTVVESMMAWIDVNRPALGHEFADYVDDRIERLVLDLGVRERLLSGMDDVKKIGNRPAKLADLVEFLTDARVAQRCGFDETDTATDRAYKLVDHLRDASVGLGPDSNVRALATRELFGLTPYTKGINLSERRRIARTTLSMEESTLRKNYEDELVLDLTSEAFLRPAKADDS